MPTLKVSDWTLQKSKEFGSSIAEFELINWIIEPQFDKPTYLFIRPFLFTHLVDVWKCLEVILIFVFLLGENIEKMVKTSAHESEQHVSLFR